MKTIYMTQSNVVALCLAGAALLLFLYTFSGGRGTAEREQQSLAPSRLASSNGGQPVSADVFLSDSSSKMRMDSHVVAFFKQQSKQRKSMFKQAFANPNPSISQVLLPLVLEAYCPSLVRVGSVGDGGKWVCNPWAMPKDGVVFSLGSHNDISFEKDYQQATGNAAQIITVDMNAASKSALDGLSEINAIFVHAMIANKTELATSPPHYTVADLMKKMGHERIEILKMDIEGAEFTVLPQFLKSNAVCQIMVEIHEIAQTPKILREVGNAGFLLQKYELNAFWTGRGLCEYSFIHESCLNKYGATLLASYIKE